MTKQPYVWVVGVCFIAGMFAQWQEIHHHLEDRTDGGTTTQCAKSRSEIRELRHSVQDKNDIIQNLERETVVLSSELDAEAKEDLSIIATLKQQLDAKQREISRLTQQLNRQDSHHQEPALKPLGTLAR